MRDRMSPHKRKSRGVATLFVSVALVLLTTLAALYLNRSAVGELRTLANQTRAQQALQAADSGLTCAINAYFDTGAGGFTYDIKTAAGVAQVRADCLAAVAAANAVPIRLTNVRFCDYSVPVAPVSLDTLINNCVSPPTGNSVLVVATGTSADGSALRHASIVLASRAGGLRLGNIAPLTVKGASGTLTGNASVVNNENNLTIWTGAEVGALSGSFETFVNIDGTNNQKSSEKEGGTKFNLGPDVVTNDHNLRNLTQENYERLGLLQTFDEFKQRAELKIDLASTTAAAASALISAGGWKTVAVFHSGGGAVDISLGASAGTASSPVVIAVDGNITFTGKPTIYGSIYSSGRSDFKGGGDVYGAVIANTVEGPPGKGNFTITADSSTMAKVEEILDPSRAAVSGTWRDW
ncbi:hypothetical protein HA630_06900 [Aquabacterium sp. A08]|nr:hypothetical protein [Aquabacterium sp. A08]